MSTKVEPPREGLDALPDGHRVVLFDGRSAVWADTSVCKHGHDIGSHRFLVKCGYGVRGGPHVEYTDLPEIVGFRSVEESYPDDPAVAESAWSRAEHFVRTGELE